VTAKGRQKARNRVFKHYDELKLGGRMDSTNYTDSGIGSRVPSKQEKKANNIAGGSSIEENKDIADI
jgi:hypothetical protein